MNTDALINYVHETAKSVQTFTNTIHCKTCHYSWQASWHGYPGKTAIESISRLVCEECWDQDLEII